MRTANTLDYSTPLLCTRDCIDRIAENVTVFDVQQLPGNFPFFEKIIFLALAKQAFKCSTVELRWSTEEFRFEIVMRSEGFEVGITTGGALNVGVGVGAGEAETAFPYSR